MEIEAVVGHRLERVVDGVEEVRRKFFGTLYNTYSFFALYANIDQYEAPDASTLKIESANELDRWIISKLNSLIKEVTSNLEDYEPTKAVRHLENFVDRHLSNWYVRLSRRRFWKSEDSNDKKEAYNTLYQCLQTVAQLMSPVAPFFSDWLYLNLNNRKESVHLSLMPIADNSKINLALEERMEKSQDICSLILSLRKKESIKVRQPLNKVMIPVLNQNEIDQYRLVEEIIKAEVNIKSLEYITNTTGMFTKMAKPNFKLLGKKMGQQMKTLTDIIAGFTQEQIAIIERDKAIEVNMGGCVHSLLLEEVEISTSDMPGWLVANENGITVALDITLTEALISEGHARELINKIQNFRKDNGFEVTDRIKITLGNNNLLQNVINHYKSYICTEVLANSIEIDAALTSPLIEINELQVPFLIEKDIK